MVVITDRLPLCGEQVVQKRTGIVMSVISFTASEVRLRATKGKFFKVALNTFWERYIPVI
jgi:hypothetical protein